MTADLNFESNSLTSTIPTQLGNLVHMDPTSFRIQMGNALSPAVPSELSNLLSMPPSMSPTSNPTELPTVLPTSAW